MTTTYTHTNLSFNRNAYMVSARGTRVYYALTYGQIEGMPSYAPSGSYNIEKLTATMWVVTAKLGGTMRATQPETVRRVGTFRTLAIAQKAAQDDYAR